MNISDLRSKSNARGGVSRVGHCEAMATIRALRGCCEAVLTCSDDNNLVARQQARAAFSQVDAWLELEKQARR